MKRVWSFKTAFYELWKITSLWTQTGPWSDTASYAKIDHMMSSERCDQKNLLNIGVGGVLARLIAKVDPFKVLAGGVVYWVKTFSTRK